MPRIAAVLPTDGTGRLASSRLLASQTGDADSSSGTSFGHNLLKQLAICRTLTPDAPGRGSVTGTEGAREMAQIIEAPRKSDVANRTGEWLGPSKVPHDTFEAGLKDDPAKCSSIDLEQALQCPRRHALRPGKRLQVEVRLANQLAQPVADTLKLRLIVREVAELRRNRVGDEVRGDGNQCTGFPLAQLVTSPDKAFDQFAPQRRRPVPPGSSVPSGWKG